MKVVTIPTDIPPNISFLAIQSQSSRKNAPRMAENGTSIFESDDTIFLAMLGMIRPTKPMVPTKLTVMDVNTETITMQIILVMEDFTPSDVASLSSTEAMLMGLDITVSTQIMIRIEGIRNFHESGDMVFREPRLQ